MVTNVDAQVADVVEDGPHVDKSVFRGGSSVTSWCPRSKDEDRLSAARLFPQPTPSSQCVAGARARGATDERRTGNRGAMAGRAHKMQIPPAGSPYRRRSLPPSSSSAPVQRR